MMFWDVLVHLLDNHLAQHSKQKRRVIGYARLRPLRDCAPSPDLRDCGKKVFDRQTSATAVLK